MSSYSLTCVEAFPSLVENADIIEAINVNIQDECVQLWGEHGVATVAVPDAAPKLRSHAVIEVDSMDQLARARAAVELAKNCFHE